MLKCLLAGIITVTLAILVAGCSDRNRNNNLPEPDPTGLPVGVYDQTKFDDSVWGS